MIIGNEPTEPSEPSAPTDPIPGETLPGGGDNGTEEDDRPTSPTVPDLPDDPGPSPETPVKQSVKIGNMVFYAMLGLIFIVCFILLRKIQKERGA